ncbi:MAG TPA: periplasmic heavy metal sensor [Bacteroidales bacterium]
MNYFLKYRFAIWAIIILSVIILSSFGTLLFLRYSHRQDGPRDEDSRRRSQIGLFFKNELKLSSEQEKLFKGFRHQFFQNSKVIFDSLEKKRIRMIEVMSSANPDSLVLFKISDDVGDLHSKLKRENVKFILNLRSICTPEQIQKLNTINKDLIGPEGPMHRMNPHRGQSHRPDQKEKTN